MARQWCQVLVPLGSRVNPGRPLGLLLLPPRSQDPTPPSAPQEATDGGKVAEPLGEPLPTACLTLPIYLPTVPRGPASAVPWPSSLEQLAVSCVWASLLRTAPCQVLVSVGDFQATLRGTSCAPNSLDR